MALSKRLEVGLVNLLSHQRVEGGVKGRMEAMIDEGKGEERPRASFYTTL